MRLIPTALRAIPSFFTRTSAANDLLESVMYFAVQSDMNNTKRAIAATELLLISPAVLFMTALFVRSVQPQQYEPAHIAQQIVMSYSAWPHVGLWILLIALPFAVLII